MYKNGAGRLPAPGEQNVFFALTEVPKVPLSLDNFAKTNQKIAPFNGFSKKNYLVLASMLY